MRRTSLRRPTLACRECGRHKRPRDNGKLPPHHRPDQPGVRCLETAGQALPFAPRPLRRTRLRPKNPARAAQRRARDFGPVGEWLREQRCATCPAQPPSEPSHVVHGRGAGGGAGNMIPSCASCHQEYHRGRHSFCAARGLDLAELGKMAAWYADRWHALPREERERYNQLFRERWPEAARALDENGGP
jgi:hypothetical protein